LAVWTEIVRRRAIALFDAPSGVDPKGPGAAAGVPQGDVIVAFNGAWRLGFQPQLGPPWFAIADAWVYLPPAFFWWWYYYDAYAPGIFIEGAAIAASGGFASIGIAIGMSVWRAREAKTITTYGSARWATKTEVRGAGLLHPDGVILGRFGHDYLRHDGPEHVLCFVPTRSGKGVVSS
jgi:type IV secretion system protein VirD4